MTAIDSGLASRHPLDRARVMGREGTKLAILSRERGSTGPSGRLRPKQDRGEICRPGIVTSQWQVGQGVANSNGMWTFCLRATKYASNY